ncbi:MAG TPA: hypothetical protein VMW62_04015 [Chloroflexota bacterium]|nr:hypothetical protein [Chloroflexota bacterium]
MAEALDLDETAALTADVAGDGALPAPDAAVAGWELVVVVAAAPPHAARAKLAAAASAPPAAPCMNPRLVIAWLPVIEHLRR